VEIRAVVSCGIRVECGVYYGDCRDVYGISVFGLVSRSDGFEEGVDWENDCLGSRYGRVVEVVAEDLAGAVRRREVPPLHKPTIQ
jgi:hypothetical protein